MTIDKFGRHLIHNEIRKHIPTKIYQYVLYLHDKEKGSQKHQKQLHNYILRNNLMVYIIPIKAGVVDNIVSHPDDILYHYNRRVQIPLNTLIEKRIFKGHTLAFTSKTAKAEDLLIIEITVNCE